MASPLVIHNPLKCVTKKVFILINPFVCVHIYIHVTQFIVQHAKLMVLYSLSRV